MSATKGDERLRVLFLGEIVGKAGVYCVKSELSRLKREHNIDFVVANGDGATGGFGLGKNHAIYLHKLGVECITGGDQLYFKKDMVPHIGKAPYILRPANLPPAAPGRGWRFFDVGQERLAICSLLGMAGFSRVHASNPFTFLPELVDRMKREASAIILDFHAVTTAEKYTMYHVADGMLSAIIGTGHRSLTADAAVSRRGTGFLCDAGRTGSLHSVGGLDPSIEIQKFMRQIPERSKEWWEGLEIQGAVIEVNASGTAVSVETLRHQVEQPKEATD